MTGEERAAVLEAIDVYMEMHRADLDAIGTVRHLRSARAELAADASASGPPWTSNGTVYFYSGPLSNFAPTPGLELPVGYYGHREADRVPVASVEHWFQACKTTSRREFDRILACPTAAAAKSAGRETQLRPDWEEVKREVMLCALRGKFAREPYRSALLATSPRPLAENSPRDFAWGARDAHGGYTGQNLLGVALMQVRGELSRADSAAGAAPDDARAYDRRAEQQTTRQDPTINSATTPDTGHYGSHDVTPRERESWDAETEPQDLPAARDALAAAGLAHAGHPDVPRAGAHQSGRTFVADRPVGVRGGPTRSPLER